MTRAYAQPVAMRGWSTRVSPKSALNNWGPATLLWDMSAKLIAVRAPTTSGPSAWRKRQTGVNIKLNPIRALVEGKRIMLINDSIVRGTTWRGRPICCAGPGPKRFACGSAHRLLWPPAAAARTLTCGEPDRQPSHREKEIAGIIGVDSLGYLSVEHLLQIQEGCDGFCTVCFRGAYPSAIPSRGEKDRLERKIRQRIKTKEVNV